MHGKLQCYAALAIVFIVSGCQKQPPPAQPFFGPYPDTVSVLEYNVENLFDMTDNGTEYPEYKPGAYNWTLSTFQVKLDNIASVIAAANPDIAVLVEIENENALRELIRVLKTKNHAFDFYAVGDKPNRTNTVPCILSRFPILSSKGIGMPKTTESGFSRNLLESDIDLGSATLKVYACHWPSKKEPESFRLAAAAILKQHLDSLSPKTDYILAGDFNENYDECANFHTLGLDDTHGKTGVNHILGTVKSLRGVYADYLTKTNIMKLGANGHYDPWLDINENTRMNEVYRRQRNTPDHILLPRALFDSSGLSYCDNSFSVFSWDGRLLLNGAAYRWQMRFENGKKFHKAEGYSDHLPIMLRLRKGPFCLDSGSPSLTNIPKVFGKKNTGGFESGVEGWVACATHITCMRDTNSVRYGKYCLKISGNAGKQNVSAARALLTYPRAGDSLDRCLEFAVRGHGTISLRIRVPKAKKWIYFNGINFKPAKAAKYTAFNFTQWTTAHLALADHLAHVHEIEFEIRVSKQTPLDLQIDNIAIKNITER